MSTHLIVIFLTGLMLTACQMNTIQDTKYDRWEEGADVVPEQPAKKPAMVDAKYSLAKDRAELDKLRESLPPEVRNQNDEKAFLAELMGEVKYPPETVREKFSNLVRKKRELFNKDMNKSREEFGKVERKTREGFTRTLTEEREKFLKSKVDREKRADFFNQQDEDRRTFMAEQKEKRDEYEADVREKRKNFEDYLKEKSDDFNFELKNYQAAWRDKLEMQKLEKEIKK